MASASTLAGQVPSDIETPSPQARTSAVPAAVDDACDKTRGDDDKALLLLRIAGALVAISQLAIAIPDLRANLTTARYVAPLYGFNLCLGIAFIALAGTRWMRLHWRPATLAACACVMTSVAVISVANGEPEFMVLTALMLPLTAGAILPWSIFWQDSLFVLALIAFAAARRAGASPDPVPVLHWVSLLVAGAAGHFAAFIGEKHRAALSQEHRELEVSESILLKTLDSIVDPLTITEFPSGRYIKVNDEFLRLAGLRREDVLGKTYFELGLSPESPAVNAAAMEILHREGKLRNFEADFRLQGGKRITALFSSILVELAGRPCALTVARDVTELKQAYRELDAAREAALAASRAKSEFLSSMSHEIRTPMNAILGMADLLAETALNDEQRRFVQTMTSNGNALLYLINGILDLAKVESGRLHLEETDFDLDELVERVAGTLSVRAHEKGLELAVRIARGLPLRVVGDPLRLRQVLVNLVGNAIKFTERGEVVLTVENEPAQANGSGGAAAHGANGADGRVLHFSVRDTGIGIAPEECEAIFQSFTQADSSTTRRYGGSGLGLAIARRLVELMGGRIWVESAPGRGSTFHFTTQLKASDGPCTGLEAAIELDGLWALLADDNAGVRAVLREMLEARGAEVVEADGGESALRALDEARNANRPFRLLILDSEMPDVDGGELAERIRNDRSHDSVAIVLLTSGETRPPAGGALKLVARVPKPVRRVEFFTAIATMLVPQRAKVNRAPALSQAQSRANRPLRILLAEDSPDNRLLIEAYLKDLPYELDEAENGELAVQKFVARNGNYDLVLMDVQMPVMDGNSAVKKIRQWEREHDRPSTPIVALTASVLEDDIRRSLDAGCTTHIGKPVKKSRLLAVLSAMTEDARLQVGANREGAEAPPSPEPGS